MEDNNKNGWKNMFTDWGGSYQKVEVHSYLTQVDKLYNEDDIAAQDRDAQRLITDAEILLERLKDYRRALTERYNELQTIPSIPCVELKRREPSWGQKGITYTLTTYRHFIGDSTKMGRKEVRYTGRERHLAIRAFKQYIKEHPGIESKMDI